MIEGPALIERSKVQRHRIESQDQGRRIDNFLLGYFKSIPRSRVYRLLRKGEVRVNKKRVSADYRLIEGDEVRLPPVRIEPESSRTLPGAHVIALLEQSILFEDARILAINKPAGIAVHGGSGLSFGVIEALRFSRPLESLELVHRLDRDTSGCLIIARTRPALRALHALVREGKVYKSYVALLAGRMVEGERRIDAPLVTDERVKGERHVRVGTAGKASTSLFKPVERYDTRATLAEIDIPTGRMHQIRVHAAHAGHPVIGDEKYGDAEVNNEFARLGLKRPFLHSSVLAFEWPSTGEKFRIEAPLPQELSRLLESLRNRETRGSKQPAKRDQREADECGRVGGLDSVE